MFNKKILTAGAVAALFALPMTAQAVTVSGDVADGATVAISVGDIFAMEIDGMASDTGGTASFGFTATENLITLESNSINPSNGFEGATVEWNSMENGSGTSFGSITGAALMMGGELSVLFGTGETKWLIASWTDVTRNSSNFDLRVEAINPIPLPAGALLMGTALAGFGIARRRRK